MKALYAMITVAFILVAASSARAEVFCKTSSGALFARTACLSGETSMRPDRAMFDPLSFFTSSQGVIDVSNKVGTDGSPVVPVGRLKIPDWATWGQYLVVAKVVASSDTGAEAFVTCQLVGTGPADYAQAVVTAGAQTLVLQSVTGIGSGNIQLACTDYNAAAGVKLEAATITATQIDYAPLDWDLDADVAASINCGSAKVINLGNRYSVATTAYIDGTCGRQSYSVPSLAPGKAYYLPASASCLAIGTRISLASERMAQDPTNDSGVATCIIPK